MDQGTKWQEGLFNKVNPRTFPWRKKKNSNSRNKQSNIYNRCPFLEIHY